MNGDLDTVRGRSRTCGALGLCLFGFATVLSLTEIRSFDYWWHLRTGQLIVETGAIPRADPYTYTVPGARWIDIHWLFQCLLYAVWSIAGHDGVVVTQWAMALALAALVASIGFRRDRPAVSALAAGLMLALASQRFMPRPELPSMLLLACVLWLFDRFDRRGDSWLYGVVPLQLVWANVHGLFAVGIVVCAIHVAGEALRGLATGCWKRARLRRLTAVTVLAAVAPLANPNGLDGLLLPLEQIRMITTGTQPHGPWVVEIGRLLGSQPRLPGVGVALALGTAALALAAMLLNRRRLRESEPLLWGAFLFLVLSAHRNQALFGVVCAPIIVRNLNGWLDTRAWPTWSGFLAAPALCLVLLLGIADALAGSLFGRLGDPHRFGFGVDPRLHSRGAADRILRDAPIGPIYHSMVDGGYLIWRLHPERKVMIDGRLEVFGHEKFVRLNRGDPEGFHELDDAYAFGSALLNYQSNFFEPLIGDLHRDPNWRLVFVDDTAALFYSVSMLERGGRASVPVGLDVDAPSLFPPLPSGQREARKSAMARGRFLLAVGRPAAALEIWEGLRVRHPDVEDEPLLHASMLMGTGRLAQAQRILVDLERASLDDPDTLQQVSQMLLALGDHAGAGRAGQRAIALDPARERFHGRATPRAHQAALRRKQLEDLRLALEFAVPTLVGILLAVVAARHGRA